MKYKKILTMAILTLAVFTAGCANTDDNTQTEDTQQVEDTTENTDIADESTQYPITISHAYGESVINEKPENIVAIGWGNVDVPLALGVAPVGSSMANFGAVGEDGLLPWESSAYDALGVTEPNVFSDLDGLDFEAISDANPDVILATYSGITEDEYDMLSQIAPVIAYPEIPWQTYWREQATISAKAMGMETEGIELVSEVDKIIDTAVASHPELSGKSALFTWFNPADMSSFYAYLPIDPRGSYLLDLGFDFPESITELAGENPQFSVEISSENANKLDDIDVFITYGDPAGLEALQNDPLLGQISAIKNGSVVFLPNESELAAACNPTVLSIQSTVDDYLDAISKVVIAE